MRCPRISELPDPPQGKTGWPWTAEGEQLPDLMPDGKPWPFISVVTPSFNQADYLEATIRSILLQGYPNLEYILADGGSTDGSLEIIYKYAPWLTHWESNPDGGHMAAIQKGFQTSSGQVLAWLNSDDMLFPWTFRTVAGVFSDLEFVRWLSTALPCHIVTEDGLLDFRQVPGYSRRAFFSKKFDRDFSFIQQEGSFWRKDLWEEAGARLDIALSSRRRFGTLGALLAKDRPLHCQCSFGAVPLTSRSKNLRHGLLHPGGGFHLEKIPPTLPHPDGFVFPGRLCPQTLQ